MKIGDICSNIRDKEDLGTLLNLPGMGLNLGLIEHKSAIREEFCSPLYVCSSDQPSLKLSVDRTCSFSGYGRSGLCFTGPRAVRSFFCRSSGGPSPGFY